MKTVFFALSSLALILFLYWQWHVPRPIHPHLVAITLSTPALKLWSPHPSRARPARLGSPPPVERAHGPGVAQAAAPPRNPPEGPLPSLSRSPQPPQRKPAPPRPRACLVLASFASPSGARLFARREKLSVVGLRQMVTITKLYRVYLEAANPGAIAAIRQALVAEHIRGFYLMHRAGDPSGFSLGAYDALAGAFARRVQLLHAGFHPHLEIRVHRSTRIRLSVSTRRSPSGLVLAWHGRILHTTACSVIPPRGGS